MRWSWRFGGDRDDAPAGVATTAGTGDCPPAAVSGTAPGLDPAQEANAKTVVAVAHGRGLGPTGAAIAVAAALAESSLYNYANDGTSTLIGSAEHRQLNDTERAVARQSLGYPHDKVGNNLDSIGLFQQRPMTGWGTPDQLINPATATGKFLDRMVTVANWQAVSPWTVAQKVQGSPSSDGDGWATARGGGRGFGAQCGDDGGGLLVAVAVDAAVAGRGALHLLGDGPR